MDVHNPRLCSNTAYGIQIRNDYYKHPSLIRIQLQKYSKNYVLNSNRSTSDVHKSEPIHILSECNNIHYPNYHHRIHHNSLPDNRLQILHHSHPNKHLRSCYPYTIVLHHNLCSIVRLLRLKHSHHPEFVKNSYMASLFVLHHPNNNQLRKVHHHSMNNI